MITIAVNENKWRFDLAVSYPDKHLQGFSFKGLTIDQVHLIVDHNFARPHVEVLCPVCQRLAKYGTAYDPPDGQDG